MNSTLKQSSFASYASTQQARRRKVHGWLRVTARLNEQIATQLRDIAGQPNKHTGLDVQPAKALAERLATNSRNMHNTLGTLFGSLEKSEEHLSEEDTVMGDQDSTLQKDMASVRHDVAGMKGDLALVKADVLELKADVAEIKVDIKHLKTDVASLQLDMAVM